MTPVTVVSGASLTDGKGGARFCQLALSPLALWMTLFKISSIIAVQNKYESRFL